MFKSPEISYDWKKAAAQVMDDKAVERAFMDQAYGFLANKAGKLMQDPHKLGFEVVYKNDSNTRMVGIFAFRINEQIVYVPVFFLNGEIKGTDLLYRQQTKTFVPLNEDWVSYLLEKHNYEPGVPIDKSQFTRVNNHVRFEDIAYPPNYKRDKRASSDTDIIQTLGDIDKVIESAFNKKIPVAGKVVDTTKLDNALAESRKVASEINFKPGPLVRKFLQEDGGLEAIEKLASWMSGSFEFTSSLVNSLDEKDYMPATLAASTSKSAADNSPSLVLFTGSLANAPYTELVKSSAEKTDEAKSPAVNKHADKFFRQGYCLWDARAPSDVIPVYKEFSEELDLIGSPGIYDVLMRDGSFRKAMVAPESKARLPMGYGGPALVGSCCDNSSYNIGGVVEDVIYDSKYTRQNYPCSIVVFLDGEKESGVRSGVYGRFIEDSSTMLRKKENLLSEASTGKAYRVFDAESGTLSDSFYVVSKKSDEGVTTYSCVPHGGSHDLFTLRYNPEHGDNLHTDLSKGFLNHNSYFVAVGCDVYSKEEPSSSSDSIYRNRKTYYAFENKNIAQPDIGNKDNVHDWVMEFVKKASVHYDQNINMYSVRFGNLDQTDYAPRVNIAVKLASAGIHADSVDDLLDEAKNKGSIAWFYGDPSMEKLAFPTMQLRDAIFREEHDRDFGVNKQVPQSYVLKTKTESLQTPPQLVGDAYDPGMGVKMPEDGMKKDQLMTMSPDQIAQYASSNQLPNVFEHGVVGSLVQVFDSVSMIDKYLPDMEEGLDRVGRILFLFYWKPRDFEEAYGTDDMTNLENQLLSNFKSFGTVVLDLLKRSKKRRSGTVSLGN